MTRKRFIKLVMSYREDKINAMLLSELVNKKGTYSSYQILFNQLQPDLRLLKCYRKRLSAAKIETSNKMEYHGYHGTARYSREDDILYGTIRDITDSVSYEGNTAKELIRNFKEAVDDYLKFCEEINKCVCSIK